MLHFLGFLTRMCDEIRFGLMDSGSAIAAANIANGATYWQNQGGGISVANDALVVHTDARQARQIRALLRAVTPDNTARRTPSRLIPAHTRAMLKRVIPRPNQPASAAINISGAI